MVQMIPRSQQVGGLYVTLKHSTSSTIILGYIYSGVSYVSRELKTESYGVDLLHVPQSRTVTPPLCSPFIPKAIGFVYVAKAKHHLATRQTFLGVGGWLHNVQGKYHVFSETYAPHTPTKQSVLTFTTKGLNRTVRNGIESRFRPNPSCRKRRKPQPRGKTQT